MSLGVISSIAYGRSMRCRDLERKELYLHDIIFASISYRCHSDIKKSAITYNLIKPFYERHRGTAS
jgi:hypothetical protein